MCAVRGSCLKTRFGDMSPVLWLNTSLEPAPTSWIILVWLIKDRIGLNTHGMVKLA